MPQLHAQPYDISATGFYFDSAEEYDRKAAALRNDDGNPAEEFEIQFIDGDAHDCALASAIGLTQANVCAYLTCTEAWDEREKILTVIAVGECCYDFDPDANPDHYEIDIYHVSSLQELAEQFVEEGLYCEIPEQVQFYIDYDAIARDLGMDYAEITIAGETLIYRAS
ncbi:MAG: antirestriction protein ArdA [Rhodobacteraceae bacterium]|nr:antirestriction protein ArdA [Paracoccaceae bacterium]